MQIQQAMILLAVAISFSATYLLTPLTVFFANKLGLVDDPKKRKHPAHTHEGIIPRAGGLPIYISILVVTLLFIPLNKLMSGILLGSFCMLLVGLLDDRYDLSPYLRFFLNLFCSGLVVLFGLGIPYVTNPLGGIIRLDTFYITIDFFGEHSFLILANVFAIIWITAMTNFVNWSKGVDGQLPGFVAIASFFLGVLALRFSAHDVSIISIALLAFIVGAAFVGFLPYNFYPQKIMPGYSGGALAGFLLGVISILSFTKVGTLILVLSVPVVDAIYVITRRLVRFRSPFKGDAGHFHHRLLEIGWGRRRVAVFYWLISFLFGLSSLFLRQDQKLLAILLVIAFLAAFILILNRVKKIKKTIY